MIERLRKFISSTLRKAALLAPGLGAEFNQLHELRSQLDELRGQRDKLAGQLESLQNEALRQSRYLPGHYYSTIPDWQAVGTEVGNPLENVNLRGIDLNDEKQLALLTGFVDSLGSDFWKEGGNLVGPRYQWPNNFFHWTDAGLLTHIISHYRPRRIVEVGCGYSSAVVSDTVDRHGLDLPGGRVLIDPDFSRTRSLIPQEEISRCTLHEKKVQDAGVEEYLLLSAGDILLIDSSHVTKHGSDVNFLIFEVLPQLASGVIVHFHDVFVPFDYPASWYAERRGWNEAFLLRAFLQFNADFKILAFADFLRHRWPSEMAAAVGGGSTEVTPREAVPYASLWLQRK
jgi:hypothetical protein